MRFFDLLLFGVVLTVLPLQAQSVDGVWRSQGYGDVFEIRGTSVKTYQVTSATCVPGFTARRDPATIAGRDATFTGYGDEVFFIRAGGEKDHKLLHNEGSASDVRLDRVPRVPAMCDLPTPNTPAGNFEVFAKTWAEQYISFDLRHVDWDKVVTENRPRVTTDTSPVALFAILASMIQPFGDGHASINAPAIGMRFHEYRLGFQPSSKSVLRVTDSAYLKSPLQKFCNNQVGYGHINETTGYLRILSFQGFSAAGDFASGLAELEKALDTIFSDPSLKALVIDVRINSGGADPLGLTIASRLTTDEYLAYTKAARADPVDRNKWTPGDPSVVKPSARPGFRGPVVELIGPSTRSAGETFTQALMGRSPHVTRIGENTQGLFSDTLDRNLPNGWEFGLPNEVFFTPDGRAFDVSGIPPDIIVPVFADDDIAAGRDPAMAKALEILGQR